MKSTQFSMFIDMFTHFYQNWNFAIFLIANLSSLISIPLIFNDSLKEVKFSCQDLLIFYFVDFSILNQAKFCLYFHTAGYWFKWWNLGMTYA